MPLPYAVNPRKEELLKMHRFVMECRRNIFTDPPKPGNFASEVYDELTGMIRKITSKLAVLEVEERNFDLFPKED